MKEEINARVQSVIGGRLIMQRRLTNRCAVRKRMNEAPVRMWLLTAFSVVPVKVKTSFDAISVRCNQELNVLRKCTQVYF